MSDSPVLMRCEAGVAVLTLNRPDVLNALNASLATQLPAYLDQEAADDGIGAIIIERRQFHATFAALDQKEGMAAFVDARTPEFKHR